MCWVVTDFLERLFSKIGCCLKDDDTIIEEYNHKENDECDNGTWGMKPNNNRYGYQMTNQTYNIRQNNN